MTKMLKILILTVLYFVIFTPLTAAQSPVTKIIPPETPTPSPTPAALKKPNQRPANTAAEPFDNASVEKMAAQCVRLETEAGVIEMEMFPESAPETVRNFLNLVVVKAFDTTKFSRVVPNFVVQGGNLSTREKMTPYLANRSRRTIPDEPSQIRHERGIVSMARPETPNGVTTHFFILVNEAKNLDGIFSAFARVTNGMEVVDAINKMPVEGDKPVKPVQLVKAAIIPCASKTQP